jgi:hypothetical protein
MANLAVWPGVLSGKSGPPTWHVPRNFPDAAILMHRDWFAAVMFHVKFRHPVHSVHSHDDPD